MVKFLFVIAHADPHATSTSHQLARSAEAHLKSKGHEVRLVDLINCGFKECASTDDFVKQLTPNDRFNYAQQQSPLDNLSSTIREQQENLLWCNNLIIFGPVWFYHLPACLYAYIERVFTAGWAYNFNIAREELPLYGRKALIVATTGAEGGYYSHGKGLASLDALFYSTTYGIHGCGFEVYRSQGIWSAAHLPPEQFEKKCQQLNLALEKLEKRPLLPFSDPGKKAGTDEIETFIPLQNIELEDAANA
ncbi:Flavodoxin-like fold family protein [Tritrichomonas foetus]|uniref:Flavodoxin-like fold family protein n=1 Tax=Tritrichomonas foetus TaxID=1144522 RepID=A0A1J4JF86_9EUKA|nr:Flavodoxin-like fold family protein [Tritrichomonas foetus]|eukprot:OHS95900.1 Flavodoxin-like fold family protein [Tritrichomonas foetus]